MEMAECKYYLTVTTKGEKRIAGKVLELADGRTVLYRWIPREQLRTGLLSLDARALHFVIGDPDISEIHFENATGDLYSMPKADFERHAVPLDCGEKGRVHVPAEHWKVRKAWYAIDDRVAYGKHAERAATVWPDSLSA